MPTGDEAIRALREAVKLSPDNVVLRQHLADTLLDLGRHAEAAEEYRQALAREPASVALMLGLASIGAVGMWGLMAGNQAKSGIGIFFLTWLTVQLIANAVLMKE